MTSNTMAKRPGQPKNGNAQPKSAGGNAGVANKELLQRINYLHQAAVLVANAVQKPLPPRNERRPKPKATKNKRKSSVIDESRPSTRSQQAQGKAAAELISTQPDVRSGSNLPQDTNYDSGEHGQQGHQPYHTHTQPQLQTPFIQPIVEYDPTSPDMHTYATQNTHLGSASPNFVDIGQTTQYGATSPGYFDIAPTAPTAPSLNHSPNYSPAHAVFTVQYPPMTNPHHVEPLALPPSISIPTGTFIEVHTVPKPNNEISANAEDSDSDDSYVESCWTHPEDRWPEHFEELRRRQSNKLRKTRHQVPVGVVLSNTTWTRPDRAEKPPQHLKKRQLAPKSRKGRRKARLAKIAAKKHSMIATEGRERMRARHSLAATYAADIHAIASKAVLRLYVFTSIQGFRDFSRRADDLVIARRDPIVKRKLCRNCHTVLIPGVTSSVKIKRESNARWLSTIQLLSCIWTSSFWAARTRFTDAVLGVWTD